MEIELSTPEKTLLVENNRDSAVMALEDIIYWCFSVEIRIIGSSNLSILLPKICLFQVIECLSQAAQEILANGKTRVWTDDKYNPHTFFIESKDEIVTIKYSGQELEIFNDDFLVGVKEFVPSSIAQARESFPRLNLNPDFNLATESWLKDINN